jgi:hypothetical protein
MAKGKKAAKKGAKKPAKKEDKDKVVKFRNA